MFWETEKSEWTLLLLFSTVHKGVPWEGVVVRVKGQGEGLSHWSEVRIFHLTLWKMKNEKWKMSAYFRMNTALSSDRRISEELAHYY